MKYILALEEFTLFLGGLYLFSLLDFAWYIFPLLLFVPDIFMIGYVINPKIGAYVYNIGHTRTLAVILLGIGYVNDSQILLLMGVILFSHIALDRMLGFGLKYNDTFHHTHLD